MMVYATGKLFTQQKSFLFILYEWWRIYQLYIYIYIYISIYILYIYYIYIKIYQWISNQQCISVIFVAWSLEVLRWDVIYPMNNKKLAIPINDQLTTWTEFFLMTCI